MKRIKHYLLATLAVVFITACDEDQNLIQDQLDQNPLPTPTTGTSGNLDLSKYVSIGNSIAAGFQDGALYTDAQEQNFAKFLATQLQSSGVGGGEFNQPDINSDNGYSGMGPNGPLGRFFLDLSIPGPSPTAGELPTAFAGNKAALNNFAVPGMKMIDASSPALASNALYARFASNPGVSTVLGDALAASPTFFTLELGANDVLGYATNGGDDEGRITSAGDFQAAFQNTLGALVASGAKGVVVNVPMMLTAPFFRAVPYNAVPLTEQSLVDQLNGAFAGLNAALDGLVGVSLLSAEDANARKVTYSLGANPILILDDALEDLGPKFDILMGAGAITPAQRQALDPYRQSRPATAADLPLLPSASEIGRDVLGNGLLLSGISFPIADRFILTGAEQVNVVTARATFNAIISGVIAAVNANAPGAVVEYDVNVMIADLSGISAAQATALALSPAAIAATDGVQGFVVDGVNLAPDFSPNGIFSTDGIHPNPRGHGIVTNAIIDLINDSFDANIPKMNILALRSVLVQ